MEIVVTVLSGLWIFLLAWVLKIQKDLGKMRQNEITIMKELMILRQDQNLYQRTDKCTIMHAASTDTLNQFKEMVLQRLHSIEQSQIDIQKDIKELLKHK